VDLLERVLALGYGCGQNPRRVPLLESPPEGVGKAHAASESVWETQEDEERRGWFRRFFSF
jgi:hypothetical protein